MAGPRAGELLDVEGPVRAEIFMIWLNVDHLELTGPDGPAPWIVQIEDVEHPVEVVERIVTGLVGAPLLVHSTSWRRDAAAVILSFLVVIGPDQVGGMASQPIVRAELARSEALPRPADRRGLRRRGPSLRAIEQLVAEIEKRP